MVNKVVIEQEHNFEAFSTRLRPAHKVSYFIGLDIPHGNT